MSPADRGLQVPERESAPVVDDPAVLAGKEAQEAAAAWSAYAKAHPTRDDEKTPEYRAVQERSEKADESFSAAPVTSLAGALTKLRALQKDTVEDSGMSSWELGHIKTVIAFLEGVECAPSVVGDDPAVVALAEYRVAKAADDAISNKDAEAETPEYQATSDRYYAAVDVVFAAVPTSMAGIAVLDRFIAVLAGGESRSGKVIPHMGLDVIVRHFPP